MTNIVNLHTLPICSVDLFTTVILITEHHLLQITSNVISRSSVHVPVHVNPIRTGDIRDALLWRT